MDGIRFVSKKSQVVCEKKGLTLEDHGLYPRVKEEGTKLRLKSTPAYSEEDVFKELGLEYKPPTERDYH